MEKIDIQSYMIGDWLWCGSNYGQVAEIFTLKDELLITVNNRRNKYFEEINPFEVTTGAEDIRPIPLTTEILEKNGFKKSVSPPGIHAKCYELNNKDKKYHLTIANYNKYKRLLLDVDSEDSECFNIKCDYVHELQHALKLCGIEKKIIL